MDEKNTTDHNYWGSAQTGFNFEENDVGSLPSLPGKNVDLKSLQCDGLIEASENSLTENRATQFQWLDEEKTLITSDKKSNPLDFNLKQEKQDPNKLSTSQIVKCMILGRDYSLEPFKSKKSKLELLKAAVNSHDGNTILAVILFLKNTLKKSIFYREILLYPDAVRVYLSYLEEDHETDELANVLLLLDNPDEASMIKYKSSLLISQPERKLKSINNCLSTHFQPNVVDDFLRASVVEHKHLLSNQIAVDEHHNAANPGEIDIFDCYHQLTSERKLVDTSVICSLVFCCLYYYKASEAAFMSPAYIKSTYNLSKKQFTWGALRALVATQRWEEMNDLFMIKNWLGNAKVKSCINFSQVIRLLSRMQASHDLITKYVCFIENQELKLLLAKKYKCHSVVIEILKNNRDRLGLQEYKNILPPHSVDFCSATDILNNKTMKWRN